MKRSELTDICNKIIQMHLGDLKSELPYIISKCTDDSKSVTENTAALIANITANSIGHSVQAVTDVLANVGLVELEDD